MCFGDQEAVDRSLKTCRGRRKPAGRARAPLLSLSSAAASQCQLPSSTKPRSGAQTVGRLSGRRHSISTEVSVHPPSQASLPWRRRSGGRFARRRHGRSRPRLGTRRRLAGRFSGRSGNLCHFSSFLGLLEQHTQSGRPMPAAKIPCRLHPVGGLVTLLRNSFRRWARSSSHAWSSGPCRRSVSGRDTSPSSDAT